MTPSFAHFYFSFVPLSPKSHFMAINKEAYQQIKQELTAQHVTLVAVSKTKPIQAILELYELGQRDFGENYVQELTEKQPQLPPDIRWHFIGHLQSNKVKYIAPFVHLIHGVDSLKLLQEINKQAARNNRTIQVLLQAFIAQEETKFGLDENELAELLQHQDLTSLTNITIAGLMGMASFTENTATVRQEFKHLKALRERFAAHPVPQAQLNILSMGMSADYQVAIEEGSNMVRIGSLLFGARS